MSVQIWTRSPTVKEFLASPADRIADAEEKFPTPAFTEVKDETLVKTAGLKVHLK